MGNIMISVDDEKEKEIRKYAQEIYGGKKGSLSEFVWAAIADYISHVKKDHERKAAVKRMLARMEKGISIGFKGYKSRDEIYESRLKKISGY